MWANYFLERNGQTELKHEFGVCTYKIIHPYIELCNVYVVPTHRQCGVGSQMADSVAKIGLENNCTHMIARVDLRTNGANESLLAQLKYGFKLLSAEGSVITLSKEL